MLLVTDPFAGFPEFTALLAMEMLDHLAALTPAFWLTDFDRPSRVVPHWAPSVEPSTPMKGEAFVIKRIGRRPSPAFVISILALIVAVVAGRQP